MGLPPSICQVTPNGSSTPSGTAATASSRLCWPGSSRSRKEPRNWLLEVTTTCLRMQARCPFLMGSQILSQFCIGELGVAFAAAAGAEDAALEAEESCADTTPTLSDSAANARPAARHDFTVIDGSWFPSDP